VVVVVAAGGSCRWVVKVVGCGVVVGEVKYTAEIWSCVA
jgi:hypothetical protein